jgi:ornithine cyclodeaminase/alanine dehydrogenase-like protein (mu-crystallin family)
MLYLTESDVRALLPMSVCVDLMRTTFQGLRAKEAQNHVRRRLFLPSGSVLHSMAGAHGNYFGTKIYSTNPQSGAHFFFHLFDAATGVPLALFEANYLGQIRTGAASGYATDLLARRDADTLGIIGSGFQARAQLEAIATVRSIRDVRVWSRRGERRQAFAEECQRTLGLTVRAVDTAPAAVEGASIIATATWAKDPVIESEWVMPGAHINAMGSNHPQRRELPAALVERADVIVVDAMDAAKVEAGDLLMTWGRDPWPDKVLELKDAVARVDEAHVTVFKSVGLGVEDVTAAGYVYEQAMARGLGRPVMASAG